jgi:hypothetical protein
MQKGKKYSAILKMPYFLNWIKRGTKYKKKMINDA